MQCKIKKIIKYNVEGYDITINVSSEELKRLRLGLEYADINLKGNAEVEIILDTINKELKL